MVVGISSGVCGNGPGSVVGVGVGGGGGGGGGAALSDIWVVTNATTFRAQDQESAFAKEK